MRKLTVLAAASITILFGITALHAQDGAPTWVPVELFGCTFNNGTDMSDLDTVIENWNEWMDENGINDYTAILMFPNFTATDFPFELLWVGVWQSGASMAGLQQWFTEGASLEEDFGEVLACPLHQAFAVNNIKEPAEPQGIVPVMFSNCTINEGRTGPEARAALIELTDFLAENGSDAGHWILRPGPGEAADADYSFKWVRAFSSYASLGHDFELIYNGGGFQRLVEITGRVMSCDYPRLYNSQLVRQMAAE